jgi:hypothetical protein
MTKVVRVGTQIGCETAVLTVVEPLKTARKWEVVNLSSPTVVRVSLNNVECAD